MGLTRDHSAKWVFLLFLPFVILLFSYSSARGQWVSVTPPDVSTYWDLRGVHFTSVNEGWAVGIVYTNNTGVLLHYQNGTWTSAAPPAVSTNWYLNGIHFTSATEGWAVGRDDTNGGGVLLYYKNGAWTSVAPPNLSEMWWIYGVYFTSADDGWAVGMDYSNRSAALLRTLSFLPKEGTVGTRLSFRDSYLGSKKGKVLIDNSADKVINWDDSSIICEINKPLALGPHNVVVKVKEPKGAAPITCLRTFTIRAPEIVSVDPASGTEGAKVMLSGNYFSSKKGKVYLGDKKCKLLTWEMNANTGESTASFVVPKKMPSGTYNVKVTNKVGSDTLIDGFTIP